MISLRNTLAVARREFLGYFATPVAVVFIVIFLVLQGVLTFNLGGFLDRDQADLTPFFSFLPWVFLLLVPPSPCDCGRRSGGSAPSNCC